MTFKRHNPRQAALYKAKYALTKAPDLVREEKWQEALQLLEPALIQLEEVATDRDEQAMLLVWLSVVYAATADFDRAECGFRKAYKVAESDVVRKRVKDEFNQLFTGDLA